MKYNRLRDQILSRVNFQAQRHVWAQRSWQIYRSEVLNQFSDKVWSQVWNEIERRINDQLQSQVAEFNL